VKPEPTKPAEPPKDAKPEPAKPAEPPKAAEPAKPAAPAPRTVTVAPGDSLSAIAQRELGNGSRWRELYELNKEVVGPNPNVIRAGQTLKLPN
jgi:nucleoid-associated protein YgaU